ncbi:MAG: hypothetical protein ABI776_07315 [Nocardioidaceae bacterium]
MPPERHDVQTIEPDRASAPRPRSQRHLMSAGGPRPQARYSTSVDQIQRWVLSSLAIVTLGHLSAGLVVAALFLPQDAVGSRVGLLGIAGLTGVVAVVSVLLIHRRGLWSPWLMVGFVPTVVGAFLAFR